MLRGNKIKITAEQLCVRLATAWLIECIVYLFLTVGSAFPAALDAYGFAARAVIAAAAFALLSIRFCIKPNFGFEKFCLFACALVYGVLSLVCASVTMTDHGENGIYRALLCVVIIGFLAYYCLYDSKRSYCLPKPLASGITVCSVLLVFAVCAAILVSRYLGYKSGRWDFGIFTQMFDNMRDSFSMATTCERDRLLSHFAVHISPVYYLLLPLYYVFPSPVTLQLSQAAIIASAVIPLCLLCKRLKLSHTKTAVISLIFALYPVIIGSSNYDFHENCFMLPFMLWLFYFIEKDSRAGTYIFMFLNLSIKEDAAIPLAFVGLYLIVSKKKYLRGGIMFAACAVYYCICTALLTRYGDGTLALTHYGNFGDGVFTGMLKAVASAPFYFISQCINEDKLKYLIVLIVPLGAAPFLNRKLSPLILLCPIILMNLVTDYKNQFSPYFYYNYAAAAILFYLSICNLSQLSAKLQRLCCIFSLSAVLLISPLITLPLTSEITDYMQGRTQYEQLDAILADLPADASVRASECFVPHLFEIDELYALPCKTETDYVAVDLKNDAAKDSDFANNGDYVQVNRIDGLIAVYQYNP